MNPALWSLIGPAIPLASDSLVRHESSLPTLQTNNSGTTYVWQFCRRQSSLPTPEAGTPPPALLRSVHPSGAIDPAGNGDTFLCSLITPAISTALRKAAKNDKIVCQIACLRKISHRVSYQWLE